MSANVYVDGFNLYNGALKGRTHKWLDVSVLASSVAAGHTINRIRYYTARVRGTPNDPHKPARQAQYIRALRTIPNLSVHYGQFMTHPVMRPIGPHPTDGRPPFLVRVVDPSSNPPRELMMPLAPYRSTDPICFVPVWNTEEKGSDVNLATHLLWDAVKGEYDVAIIVSNDSDLVEPIKIVKEELGRQVVILNPHRNRPSAELQKIAHAFIDIRTKHLAASRFPDTLTDGRGTFSKPPSW